MGIRSDERAQALQIGAILLFGMLIISFSTYQAYVVPDQNKRVEFDHNQNLQDQFLDLRNAIVNMDAESSMQSVSLDLGTRYPSRAVAANPGPASGTLRTANTDDSTVQIQIANAEASDDDVADFWDGSTNSYETGTLVYKPGYSQYTEAPTTVYENTVLFNQFDEQNAPKTGQQLIDGSRISLIALDGQLSRASTGSYSVTAEAVSVSNTTIEISDDSSKITITLPSRLDATTWEDELLDDELTTAGGNVESITDTTVGGVNAVEITLVSGTYQLQLRKIGVGTDISTPGATYLTDIKGDGATIDTGASQDVVVEVRDEYNNPVSGVDVTARVESGGSGSLAGGSPNTVQTDAAGQATVTYNAPGSDTTDDVELTLGSSFSGFTASNPEDVAATITVDSSAGGSTTGDDEAPDVTIDSAPSSVIQGETFDLKATADDSGNGGSAIDTANWADGSGTPKAMQATDGAFDEATEKVQALDIDTSVWTPGDHDITVTATDTNDQDGTATTTVTVQSSSSGTLLEGIPFEDNSGNELEVYDAGSLITTGVSTAEIGGILNWEDGDTDVDDIVFVDDSNKKIKVYDHSDHTGGSVDITTDAKVRNSEEISFPGDFDNNGDENEVAYVDNTGELRVVRYDGSSGERLDVVRSATGNPVETDTIERITGTSDLDGDSDQPGNNGQEFAFINTNNELVIAHILEVTSTEVRVRLETASPTTSPRSIDRLGGIGDLDNDGYRDDIALRNESDNKQIHYYDYSRDALFLFHSDSKTVEAIGPAIDTDGDGKDELYFVYNNGMKYKVVGETSVNSATQTSGDYYVGGGN